MDRKRTSERVVSRFFVTYFLVVIFLYYVIHLVHNLLLYLNQETRRYQRRQDFARQINDYLIYLDDFLWNILKFCALLAMAAVLLYLALHQVSPDLERSNSVLRSDLKTEPVSDEDERSADLDSVEQAHQSYQLLITECDDEVTLIYYVPSGETKMSNIPVTCVLLFQGFVSMATLVIAALNLVAFSKV
ncbi:hypothetical protein HDE_07949 [Halotydeus destructor]|nr:hypothetical protein HDE_07949 [Halotydeus destructor]